MSGLYPGNEFDPYARYAWDHDDPLEDEDNLLPPVVECNPAAVSITNLPVYQDDCPF